MIVNRTNLDTLFKAYNASFRRGLIGQQANSMWMQVAMETSSMTAAEVYPWLGKIPGMKEWIGDRVVENLRQHAFEIRNKDYEDTIAVDRNQIEDDTYGVYSTLFEAMGEAVSAHGDEMVWPLLKKGHETLCYDGQNFFDTDHPVVGVGTVANRYGAGAPKWYLADLSRIMKPIVFQRRKRADNLVRLDRETDENVFMRREFVYGVDCRDNVGFGLWQGISASSAALTDATGGFGAIYAAMEAQKGDEGRPLGTKPTHLIVPPSMRADATKLLQNDLGEDGETNTYKGWADLVVVPWLA